MLEIFLAGLAQGASPRLERLCLNLRDEVSWRATFERVMEALEKRQALGCAGLKSLDLKPLFWWGEGSSGCDGCCCPR